jgi:hypothetical protein
MEASPGERPLPTALKAALRTPSVATANAAASDANKMPAARRIVLPSGVDPMRICS